MLLLTTTLSEHTHNNEGEATTGIVQIAWSTISIVIENRLDSAKKIGMNRLFKNLKLNPKFLPLWQLLSPPFTFLALSRLTLIEKTSKIKITGLDELSQGGPYIFTNWHEHLPYLCHHHGRQGQRCMLMSPAPYMTPIDMWCRTTGLHVIRRSNSDIALVSLAEQINPTPHSQSPPYSVVLAIDGPAGPPHVPKRGCIQLAQETGAPIVHVNYTSARGTPDLTRWDQWLWPVLADDIHIHYSSPLRIPADVSLTEGTRMVQALAASISS